LIEKYSFQVFFQFSAKSGAIDHLRLGDRPVGHPCCNAFYLDSTRSLITHQQETITAIV